MKSVYKIVIALLISLSCFLSYSENSYANESQTTSQESFKTHFEEQKELDEKRDSRKNGDLAHYGLMSHGTEKWYEFKEKTGGTIAVSIKDMFWMLYLVFTAVITEIVFQIFNLNVIDIFQDQLQSYTSSLAGTIIGNLIMLGLALMSSYIVFKAYLKQDWEAFFKLLSIMVISLVMLFSIQSKKFNYVEIIDSVSRGIENTLIATPFDPSGSEEIQSIDNSTAVLMENKVFNALVYNPFLYLNYGTINKSAIEEEREKGKQPDDYIKASPFTDKGIEKREDISKYEVDTMKNIHVNNSSAWKSIGNITIYGMSAIVQFIVYVALGIVRIGLHFAFLLVMGLLPLVLFINFIPGLERALIGWGKAVMYIILGKAIISFLMIFVMAIMSIIYSLQSYDGVNIFVMIVYVMLFAGGSLWLFFQRDKTVSLLIGNGAVMGSGSSVNRAISRETKSFLRNRSLNRFSNNLNNALNNNNNNSALSNERGTSIINKNDDNMNDFSDKNNKNKSDSRDVNSDEIKSGNENTKDTNENITNDEGNNVDKSDSRNINTDNSIDETGSHEVSDKRNVENGGNHNEDKSDSRNVNADNSIDETGSHEVSDKRNVENGGNQIDNKQQSHNQSVSRSSTTQSDSSNHNQENKFNNQENVTHNRDVEKDPSVVNSSTTEQYSNQRNIPTNTEVSNSNARNDNATSNTTTNNATTNNNTINNSTSKSTERTYEPQSKNNVDNKKLNATESFRDVNRRNNRKD